jgi:hypothetical protein
VKNPTAVQESFETESEARVFARTLGGRMVRIVHSIAKGEKYPSDKWAYWVEAELDDVAWIRYYETVVYEGKGLKA